MKLETFFEKFELFADAPDAVASLRKLVLELAVRGKLVAQCAADEPASELLKRVHVEKVCRQAQVDLSDEDQGLTSNDKDFKIPESWEWIGATVPAVMISDQGKKLQTKDILATGRYPVIDQGKVFIRGYCNDSDKVISVADPIVLFGDHTREIKFIDFDFVVGADGVKLLQPVCVAPRFYFLALCWLPIESRGYSRHFKLLRAARIPLPPLAEQERIVAKVNELMALCDRLEAQEQERGAQHTTLARASLARFAEAPAPANLDLIFHKSYDIAPADLRKSILTLAVQGKLVSQDPSDEPASKLMARISPQWTNGTAKDWDQIDSPFKVPATWCWAKLGDFVESMSNGIYKPAKFYSETGTACVRMFNIQDGYLDLARLKRLDLTPSEVEQYRLEMGDLLVNRVNSRELVGKCAVVAASEEPLVFEAMNIRVRLLERRNLPGYVNLVLRTDRIRELFQGSAKQAIGQASINQPQVAGVTIPIPPLAEQRRIVAKVDQLMTLVDALEAQLATARTTAAKLLDALVAELTAKA